MKVTIVVRFIDILHKMPSGFILHGIRLARLLLAAF